MRARKGSIFSIYFLLAFKSRSTVILLKLPVITSTILFLIRALRANHINNTPNRYVSLNLNEKKN